MSKFIPSETFVGKTFNRLTILKEVEKRVHRRVLAICECGIIKEYNMSPILTGHSKSCGCLTKEVLGIRMRTHGLTNHKLFKVWTQMKERCYNPNNNSYKNYGERGITICKEWLKDFKSFYDWAYANGYKSRLTVDRIDSNGNYEPSNCRIANYTQQGRNKRNNWYITFRGQTKLAKEWAEELGIPYQIIDNRRRRWGNDTERMLTQPYIEIKK